MLQELRVEQFAIIDRQAVRFGPGLNVLTGETGAGKSLLIDALVLAVGGRANSEVVRAGAREAVVEALFAPEHPDARAALDASLEARGLPTADGALLVKRVVSAAGRHRVYLNGGLATVSLLAEVAGEQVDIAGQHEHMALLRPGVHLSLLDAFGVPPDVQARWQDAWARLEAARAELRQMDTDATGRGQREAFLRFQLQEIEAVSPRPGEEAELELERSRLAHVERLREAAGFSAAALYAGDGAVVEVLGRICARLTEAGRLDPSLSPLLQGLEGALAVAEDHGRELSRYVERLDADPARLDQVQSRLADLRRLARRHGGDLDAVLAAAEAMRAELQGLERHEDRLEEARTAARRAEDAATAAAAVLTRSRRKAAAELGRAVQAELGGLGMAATRFEVAVTASAAGPHGADHVEMHIAPGPEEPLRPLGRIASGGELSRLLLALRRVLAARDPVPTVVFDEVDAGIGGATAEVVGRLLKGVAADRQVLCITHLPQVAAYASRHLIVSKEARDGRAHVEVRAVEGESRRDEVARMLGGLAVTERSREHAAEMLDRAAGHPGAGPEPTKPPGRGGRNRRAA